LGFRTIEQAHRPVSKGRIVGCHRDTTSRGGDAIASHGDDHGDGALELHGERGLGPHLFGLVAHPHDPEGARAQHARGVVAPQPLGAHREAAVGAEVEDHLALHPVVRPLAGAVQDDPLAPVLADAEVRGEALG
jgi:hypothetical protein